MKDFFQEPGAGQLRIGRQPDGTYRLTCAILLERDLCEVFEFFSDPHNLALITPQRLRLEVNSQERVLIAHGTRIRYRFRVRGVPARWHSEITAWEPPHRFVDEQLRGPFRSWVHEHTFEEVTGGILARDEVTYTVPGGRPVHHLFVKRELQRLFGHRHRQLRQRLGAA